MPHPSKAGGLPLSQDIYEAMTLSNTAESTLGIPPRTSFTKMEEHSACGFGACVEVLSAVTLHIKRGRLVTENYSDSLVNNSGVPDPRDELFLIIVLQW